MNKFKTLMKNPKAAIICFVVFASSIVSFAVSYCIKPQEWSWDSLFFNLAISLLQLFLALIIVNVYLENEEKKRQNEEKKKLKDIKALEEKKSNEIIYNTVIEVSKVFTEHFNNTIKDFGIDTYNEILKKCGKNDKYISFLPKTVINDYIRIIRPEYKQLLVEINNTAEKFRFIIFSGVLNDNIEYQNACIILMNRWEHLKTLDISDSKHHRMIFEDIAIIYSRVIQVVLSSLKKATSRKIHLNNSF